MSEPAELLPCPFCGGTETTILNGQVEDDWCAVSCDKCYATGPHNYTDPHSIAAWNRRALPAAPVGVVEALGAVAMRDAAVSALNSVADEWSCGHDARTCNCPSYVEQWRFAADEVAALPLPTHAAQLAAALALPEVAALVEASSRLLREAEMDGMEYRAGWDAWMSFLRKALTALEARHDLE